MDLRKRIYNKLLDKKTSLPFINKFKTHIKLKLIGKAFIVLNILYKNLSDL